MTDDLEPRLRDHFRQRAGRVSAPSDLADVHQRIDGRARARSRALGAALAIALVAGPVAGYALAQATEPDTDTVSASGGGGADSTTSPSYDGQGVILEGSGAGYMDEGMQPVSERTTGDGIRLVVRSTILGEPESEPCQVDGLVRVGIVDGDLVDVTMVESAPASASFGIAGGANGRPMWVVVARAVGQVEASFPNGSSDSTEAVNGVAVLAAYADEGQHAFDLVNNVIEVTGLSGRPVDDEGPREVLLADGFGGCGSAPPVDPPVTMPSPGDPPADEAAARAEITELFSQYGGADPRTQVDRHEEPEVWLDAALRFQEQQPQYFEWSKEVYGVVDEIVFTAPDRATVRQTLKSDNPSIPAPGEMIAEAVLIDGVWKASIESSCAGLALAGIECDYSLGDE